MSNNIYIVSLVFIVLDKPLLILGFVGDGICDSCGKVGFLMNTSLTVCAWLHVHVVNLGCRIFQESFWVTVGIFLGV